MSAIEEKIHDTEKIKESAGEQQFIETSSLDKVPQYPYLAGDERIRRERQLVRKLDMRLLPTIVLIFIMNYIDVCNPKLTLLAYSSLWNRELQ